MPPVETPDIAALLDRYERPLVRYAFNILGDIESARDVVQETFIRFVRQGPDAAHVAEGGPPLDGVEPGHPARAAGLSSESSGPAGTNRIAAWLFTVCRNRALDHQRKHSRIVPMQFPDDRADEEPSPSVTLERRDTAASLLRLLDVLSPNQREVIRLKFQNDLSYKEIAEVTQLSVTNVGFLLHTGLKKLRELLQQGPAEDWPMPLSPAIRQL